MSTQATETPDPEPKKQITLTYCGRRTLANGKIGYEYLHEDRALLYSKVKHGCVGGRYTVEALVKEDGGLTIYPTTMRYAGEKVDDVDRVAIWEALDRDAYDTTRLKAAERKHAATSALDDAMEPLLRILSKASSRAEAQALIRGVSEKLERAYWTQR